ncbi:MAG: S53 family peptidase [Acidimicrobiales bacterium]
MKGGKLTTMRGFLRALGRPGRLALIGAATSPILLVTPGIATSGATLPIAVSRTLTGTVPALVKDATEIGPLSPTTQLSLVAPLVLPNAAALDQYVSSAYQSGSASFHRFLTPPQFGARFGAPVAEVDTVEQTLQSLGFKVGTPSANHLYVDFSGPASLVESVFGVSIDTFRTTTGFVFHANTGNITVPGVIAGDVTGVIGIDNTSAPRSNLFPAAARNPAATATLPSTGTSGGTTPCAQALTSGGYTPPSLAEAYDFNGLYAKGLLGQGMNMALVEFDDFHDSNVAGVESCYGDKTTVVHRLVDGGTGGAPHVAEVEDMADISTVLGMLPELAHLYVYVAPITGVGEIDLYNSFVNDDKAPVLSSSWGNCEELNSQSDNILFARIAEEAAAQGQQIFDAAGDSGAVDCRGYPVPTGGSISVEQESAVPWITGVGGTDLAVSSAVGNHAEETWNDAGAGGGGQSTFWTMPSWQASLASVRNAPGASGAGCGAPSGQLCRMVPDLSADADPDFGVVGRETSPQFTNNIGSPGYAMYCNTADCNFAGLVTGVAAPSLPDQLGGWFAIGGTSLATPLVASEAVLWNELAKSEGLAGLGFLNPQLYAVAADATQYAHDFYDITTDSNSAQYDSSDCPTGCNPNHLYAAAPGYDMASGLGSPDAALLGQDLVARAAKLYLTPDNVQLYGYLSGPSTTSTVLASSAYSPSKYTAAADVPWLTVSSPLTSATLQWHASPTKLATGNYVGHIVVSGPGGKQVLTVHYSVTPRATISLSAKSLSFAEQASDSSGTTTTPTCGSTVWNDEFESSVSSDTTPVSPQSKQTLDIGNSGPAGSVLHWSAFPYSETSGWLSVDLTPPGGKTATGPSQPLVPTTGAVASGSAPDALPLISAADGNTLGGYPDMNQGTYHGLVYIWDLADPGVHVIVPAVMVLGNGQGTPTMASSPSSISATVAHGGIGTGSLTLRDTSNTCGYAYSAQSSVGWLSLNADQYSGTVPASGSAGSTASGDTGDGNGTISYVVDATKLAPGTYTGKITVQSQNAEPNPLVITVTLTVT